MIVKEPKEPYKRTSVPAGRSMNAISQMLEEAGAAAIQWTDFPRRGIALRFQRGSLAFRIPAAYRRPDEQGKRQALRFIFHYLKNVLAAELFMPLEQQLLAFVELEGEAGPTVGQWLIPQLGCLEERPLLPGVSASEFKSGGQWEVLPPPGEE
jgi:hypothetical protein